MAALEQERCMDSQSHVGYSDHSQSLAQELNQFRHQGMFCDVTIVVGGQKFLAHKAVLSSSSSYYRDMLSSGLEESTMSEVSVPGNGASFVQILEDLYTGHSLSLSELNQLRHQGMFCDVTIIVGGQRFLAHKAVLSSASDYFRIMFSSGFQESTMSEVTILGNGDSFAQILDFLYTGFFTLSSSIVVGVLETAKYMVLTKVVELCAQYLKEFQDKLTIDDCVEVWSIASSHSNLSETAQVYQRCLSRRFQECVQSRVFLENSCASDMMKILEEEDIEADHVTEEHILEGALLWLKHNWEQRKVHASDLLKKIRLGLVPVDRLHQILGEELLSIPECADMVAQVVHLNDTMDTTSTLLLKSHPHLYASRNTITAAMRVAHTYPLPAESLVLISTKTRCYQLTKLPDLPTPSVNPGRNFTILGRSLQICVSDAGHLYAAGINEIDYGLNSSELHRNWMEWLSGNNFYCYDPEKNEWITLPPMKYIQCVVKMYQVDEYIYAFGIPYIDDEHRNYERMEPVVMERYSFASKEWNEIEFSCGITDVAGMVEANGYMLLMGEHFYDLVDIESEVGLYKKNDSKVVNLRADGREINVRDLWQSCHFIVHKNTFYFLEEEEGNGRKEYYKVNCNFNGDSPSIFIVDDPVQDEGILREIRLAESKQLPLGTVEFTFDKRKLGMVPFQCYCSSHTCT